MTNDNPCSQIGAWQDAYSVGNEALDSQHKVLLIMCQRVSECLRDETIAGDAEYHELLNDLTEYARKHFKVKENLLRECNYSDLAAHIAEHNAYFDWLTALNIDACNGSFDKEALSRHVSEWWIRHICISDMAYRDRLKPN